MSVTRVSSLDPIYTSGDDQSVSPLAQLIEVAAAMNAPTIEEVASYAALVQHADQERIAKALEDLLEPLCVIANAITTYEGR